jgi:hypothetical protein
MGADEQGTLAQLKAHRRALVDPKIKQHRGRIVKTTGDGMLVEFASVVEAVCCAVEVQHGIVKRNTTVPQEKRIEFRIGINVGDVIIDGNDIFGDGVNVAARLEAIAEPGGIFISRQVYDQVEGKLTLRFRKLGPRDLKNIAKPVEVFAIDGIGKSHEAPVLDGAEPIQEIKYCRAFDGVRLAYAISGSGPILVKSANWMNHLEYDWVSPVWRHVFRKLSREHTLIRYDARGNGMSDWDVDELSLEAWLSDLETVVNAVGVERFPLLGISQGSAVSVAYAVRHPERVSHLILYGGFALGGKKRSPAEREKRTAMTTLMRLDWGADNPTFRQMFTGQFIPGGRRSRKIASTSCNAEPLLPSAPLDISMPCAISISPIFSLK